jgi:hypothetical protein
LFYKEAQDVVPRRLGRPGRAADPASVRRVDGAGRVAGPEMLLQALEKAGLALEYNGRVGLS